jgi:hypothetical protein
LARIPPGRSGTGLASRPAMRTIVIAAITVAFCGSARAESAPSIAGWPSATRCSQPVRRCRGHPAICYAGPMWARCVLISTVLGVSVVDAGQAVAEEPFTGCKVVAPSKEGWKIVCGSGWLLSLADGPVDFILKNYLDAGATGLQSATHGQVRRETVPLALTGGEWKVVGLRVSEAQEPGPAFVFVAHVQRAEGLRVVTCTGTAESEGNCRRAIQAVAANRWRSGPPSSLPRDVTAAAIAGREYKAPKGCEVTTQPNATFVICKGEPTLLWAQPPNDLAAIAGILEAQMREGGMQESPPLPCTVEGVSTECRAFKSPGPGDKRMAYFARATVRTQPIAVYCLSSDGRLPPACAGVMSLQRPKH